MKSVFIGMLLTIAIVLVAVFLVGYLFFPLNRNEDAPNGWDEVRVKKSELDATIQRYGLNSEEELREYLWFNCGTVLIVEEE